MASTSTWTVDKTSTSTKQAVDVSSSSLIFFDESTEVFVFFLNGLKTAAPTAASKPFKELSMSLAFSFKWKSKTLLIDCCKRDY